MKFIQYRGINGESLLSSSDPARIKAHISACLEFAGNCAKAEQWQDASHWIGQAQCLLGSMSSKSSNDTGGNG